MSQYQQWLFVSSTENWVTLCSRMMSKGIEYGIVGYDDVNYCLYGFLIIQDGDDIIPLLFHGMEEVVEIRRCWLCPFEASQACKHGGHFMETGSLYDWFVTTTS